LVRRESAPSHLFVAPGVIAQPRKERVASAANSHFVVETLDGVTETATARSRRAPRTGSSQTRAPKNFFSGHDLEQSPARPRFFSAIGWILACLGAPFPSPAGRFFSIRPAEMKPFPKFKLRKTIFGGTTVCQKIGRRAPVLRPFYRGLKKQGGPTCFPMGLKDTRRVFPRTVLVNWYLCPFVAGPCSDNGGFLTAFRPAVSRPEVAGSHDNAAWGGVCTRKWHSDPMG